MVPVESLKKLKIFREATDVSIERLSHAMVEKSFEAGEVVIKEGDISGALFIIVSGAVAVQKKLDQEGQRIKVVARLETEEFFGEMSFLENKPHSATIVAERASRLYLLPRQALNDLIDKDARAALDQILTILAGLSSRLRYTTKELVTVFEVARLVGQAVSLTELINQVVDQLHGALGEAVSLGFYQWNMFNDEYSLIMSRGKDTTHFNPTIELNDPLLATKDSHLIVSSINMGETREGLFLYKTSAIPTFDAGERQMIETVSAVLAPALATVRAREEEVARLRLERSRQERFSI